MIVWAAIKSGKEIYVGKDHSEAIFDAILSGAQGPVTQQVQGFVTDKGKFVDRYSAMDIALDTGQLQESKKEL